MFKNIIKKPEDQGLPAGFRLTDYTRLKGCGCKIPQKDLLTLLEGIVGEEIKVSDCSVTPTKAPGTFLVTTTDFFFPLIDDPYAMGRIGCANVLSDLYAMGVTECDTMLMLLAASEQIPHGPREVVTQLMMRGFSDQAREAGTRVTGGQSVRNAWPLIGGVATSVLLESDFIRPDKAVPGDLVVLTKPLGIQVAVNAHQWLAQGNSPELIEQIEAAGCSKSGIIRAYEVAAASMNRLNRTGAQLMHKYGAHAATDVTGFGYVNHATNLAREQTAAVEIELDTLPVIAGTPAINSVSDFGLLRGANAETSGALLVCLPADQAKAFCDEIEQIDGWPAWIVGRVCERSEGQLRNGAHLVENPRVIEF